MLKPITDGFAEVVYGSRFRGGKSRLKEKHFGFESEVTAKIRWRDGLKTINYSIFKYNHFSRK